jgi:thiol:disulfide interchange protein DsbD
LTQKVKITNPKTDKIVINLDFQACQNQCVNDNVDLTFAIPAVTIAKTPVTVTDTVKKLKTEQSVNSGQNTYTGNDDDEVKNIRKKLIKPKNLFER